MLRDAVFVVGCPRSGTSLVSMLLRGSARYRSTPNDPGLVWQKHLHPALRGWRSDEVLDQDLETIDAEAIARDLERLALPGHVWRLADHPAGRAVLARLRRGRLRGAAARLSTLVAGTPGAGRAGRPHTLLDKSVTNLLRLPLLERLADRPRYVYVRRNPRRNVLSLMLGWQSGEFATYRVPEKLRIAGYDGDRWCFHLVEGWRGLIESGLEEVCFEQVRRAHEKFADDAARLGVRDRIFTLDLETLTADPGATLAALARFLDLDYSRCFGAFEGGLPRVNPTSAKIGASDQEALGRENEARLARLDDRLRALGDGADPGGRRASIRRGAGSASSGGS